MQNQNNLSLLLTLDEINTILTALGERPYVQVFELVQKIQGQAAGQVRSESPIKPTRQGLNTDDTD